MSWHDHGVGCSHGHMGKCILGRSRSERFQEGFASDMAY